MMPPWLGFTMTFRRSKPQPRHGALERCVGRGTGPAPLRLGSWPHVLSSGVRVLPLFLRLGSWPYVLSSRASDHSSNIQEDAVKLNRIKVHSIKLKESSLSGRYQELSRFRPFNVSIKMNQASTPGPLTECRSGTHLDTLSEE